MKKLLIVSVIFLVGIVFCAAHCYAACTLDPANGPYTTVIKYNTGKKTIQEKWECAIDAIFSYGSGGCFHNVLNNVGDTQKICLSGEIKILYPVNEY